MQYLEAMGIDCYVPRFVLPQAKSSVACELPVANDANMSPQESLSSTIELGSSSLLPTRKADEAKARPQPSSSISEVLSADKKPSVLGGRLESSADTSGSSQKSPTSSIQSILDVVRAPSKEEVRFALALWQVNQIQVVDTRQPGDALPTDTLLSNILLSLGCLEGQLPRVERIEWPMVQTAEDKSWKAAREMVQGFLDGRLLSKPVSHFLLFGQDACQAVLGEDKDYSEMCFHSAPIEDYEACAIVLPSLSEILRAPKLKARVWFALKSQLSR